MPVDWSTAEIEVTVAEYFAMLRHELARVPYKKSLHNERARRLLNDRSRASVEYKFRNISAVLVNHGQIYIKGYLPSQNYQTALETAVLEWLAGANDLVDVVHASSFLNPPEPAGAQPFAAVLTDAPAAKHAARSSVSRFASKVDFLRLDAENHRLGTRGEEFAFELEQRRLQDDERRRDLARRVRWVARDDGDGLGYDIASFERDGRLRFIEVKTTAAGKYFPFTLSRNELAVSQEAADRYHLYRLYDFGSDPRLYILQGALDRNCILTPVQYRANFGGSRTGH